MKNLTDIDPAEVLPKRILAAAEANGWTLNHTTYHSAFLVKKGKGYVRINIRYVFGKKSHIGTPAMVAAWNAYETFTRTDDVVAHLAR